MPQGGLGASRPQRLSPEPHGAQEGSRRFGGRNGRRESPFPRCRARRSPCVVNRREASGRGSGDGTGERDSGHSPAARRADAAHRPAPERHGLVGARACYSALWMAVRRTKHLGRSSKVWMSKRRPRSTRVACAGRRNRVERGCVAPEYVATRLDSMHLSEQQKDALFAMLHSEEGHPSCARPSDGRRVCVCV